MNEDFISSLLLWTGSCAGLSFSLPAGIEIVFVFVGGRLDMLVPLDPKRDLRLSGQVIYTGNSSMEVAVKMEHIGMDEPDETVLLGTSFLLLACKVQVSSYSLPRPFFDGLP